MARKIALLMVALLLCSAVVFVSCSQDGGKPSAPSTSGPVTNKKGTVGNNLVSNGNFDGAGATTVVEEGSEVEIVEGGKTGKALSVYQNTNYGCAKVELTKFYGRGKSYYISASFKDNGTPETLETSTPKMSFTVVSNKIVETFGDEYYDSNDPDAQIMYDGELLGDEEAGLIFDIETDHDEPDDVTGNGWVTVSAIIPATEIERVLDGSTMYEFYVTFYLGEYPDQNGYKFLLDDVVIKDLNTELPRTGKYVPDSGDYVIPEEVEPEEE